MVSGLTSSAGTTAVVYATKNPAALGLFPVIYLAMAVAYSASLPIIALGQRKARRIAEQQ